MLKEIELEEESKVLVRQRWKRGELRKTHLVCLFGRGDEIGKALASGKLKDSLFLRRVVLQTVCVGWLRLPLGEQSWPVLPLE